MNWKAFRPAIEIAIEWIAAACLGGAVMFAVARLAPFGVGMAAVAGAVVAVAALAILARADGRRGAADAPFEAVAYPGEEDEVLLLDQPLDEAPLLDDPLPAIDPGSRVVRLFAAEPISAKSPPPLSGPGDMIARIEDYLGLARGSADAAERERRAERAAPADASAALHAALADIRRSLRQG